MSMEFCDYCGSETQFEVEKRDSQQGEGDGFSVYTCHDFKHMILELYSKGKTEFDNVTDLINMVPVYSLAEVVRDCLAILKLSNKDERLGILCEEGQRIINSRPAYNQLFFKFN